jgi:hypothetical protein
VAACLIEISIAPSCSCTLQIVDCRLNLAHSEYCLHPPKELNMQANVYDEGQALDVPQANTLGKSPSQKPKAPRKAGSAKWLVAALLLLSAFPLAAGAFRLTQLAGGADITPANARFFASPLPVVVHIVSAACMPWWPRSSLRPPSGGAGPAGTGQPGGS